MATSFKLMSWNVNGIRAAQKKGLNAYIEIEDPDILCIQETKAQPDQVELELSQYTPFWNSAERKGYSGTLILTKKEPMDVIYGMGIKEHDLEGRVITIEFKDYYFVTVYTPNSQRELTRLKYRVRWDRAFLQFVKDLGEKKPVIFCGDLNVAHKEIDLCNPTSNHQNAGFTDDERRGFDNIVKAGFIDTFRHFSQEPQRYTWWSYMFQARARNIGWRIDYFCISRALEKHLKSAFIQEQVMGSDHCPVGITIDGLKT